jgi:hypothetical protein
MSKLSAKIQTKSSLQLDPPFDINDIDIVDFTSQSQSGYKSKSTITPFSKLSSSSKVKSESTTMTMSSSSNVKSELTQSSIESNECSSDNDTSLEDESDTETSPYRPFGNLTPKYVDQTHLFPTYPKSHKDGYVTVVQFSDGVLTEKLCSHLKESLQYSMSNAGGGGTRIKEIDFFAKDDAKRGISMHYSVCRCAGVKTCEFFPEALRAAHTEVDEFDLKWPAQLADQMRNVEDHSSLSQIESIWDKFNSELCDRPKIGKPPSCRGRTMIRSLNRDPDAPYHNIYNRLFIGCEHWQPKEKGHIFFKLDKYDPVEILKRWGRDQCRVHAEILEELDFNWDEVEEEGIS